METLTKNEEQTVLGKEEASGLGMQRRSFLRYAGAGAAAVALFAAGCKKDKMTTPANPEDGVDLGSGDIGILNYAYALEQLEAAFYIKVNESHYAGMTSMEAAYLSDVRGHEVAHREFFKAALKTSAIPALEVDFSSIDFGSRDSVLGTAKAFEDLGVSAYNGAGRLILKVEYLLAAGKIVSVEARHAAVIRDLIKADSFADEDVAPGGIDIARSPMEVLAIAGKYIKTKINASNLPK